MEDITHKFEATFSPVDLLQESIDILNDEYENENKIDEHFVALYTEGELNELARLEHLRLITSEFPDENNISDYVYDDINDVIANLHFAVLKRAGLINESKVNEGMITSLAQFRKTLK